MLFHTVEFALLLALVLPLHFAMRRAGAQNALLLGASYFFYGWWDARFLALLWTSTAVDFAVGLALGRETRPRARRWLVGASLVTNLGLLGFFKYGGLIASTGNGIGRALGIEHALLPELRLVLPVGISFYTFQTLAYTIDVYRRRVEPCRSLVDLALYVSFFPQLVAGPIERPEHLLPAFSRPRRASAANFEAGLFLFATGWLRKALGDVAATVADPAFADPSGASAWALAWGLYAFGLQIYLDFSGYTNMARGVARMLGIELMENFDAPYFATSLREFWHRWHISLSTWLRDYLYISLGGNRSGRRRTYANLAITMVLGGLWHGAAWTFVAWGALHGLYLVVGRWRAERRGGAPRSGGALAQLARGCVTFHLVTFAWIFFRARPVAGMGAFEVAARYVEGLLGLPVARFVAPPPELLVVAGIVLALDVARRRAGGAWTTRALAPPLRGLATAALLILAWVMASGDHRAFVYFQF